MSDQNTFAAAQQAYGNETYANRIAGLHAPSPEPDVHMFEGAPKGEPKNAPCGASIVRPGRVAGFVLTGLHATTEVDFVTCLGCLRALIPKGK